MEPPEKIANLELGVSLGSGTYPDISLERILKGFIGNVDQSAFG